MEFKTVQERVINVFTERAKRQPGEITPELELSSSILDTDWKNKTERAIILVDLEDEFGCEISDDAADGWKNVADIITCLEALINPKK